MIADLHIPLTNTKDIKLFMLMFLLLCSSLPFCRGGILVIIIDSHLKGTEVGPGQA